MKRIIVWVLALFVLCLSVGLAGCAEKTDGSTNADYEQTWKNGFFNLNTAYAEAKELGYMGTLEEFVASISGKDGKSIYEIAVANGFTGTEKEYLEFIKGEKGETGVGVAKVEIDDYGHLIITLTDGERIDCGVIIPSSETKLTFVKNITDDGYIVTGRGGETDNKIVIPDTYENLPVTAIGDSAFSRDSMKEIVIPDSVISIGYAAFSGCVSLESVTMGKKVESIGDNAFYGCTALESININESLKSIGDGAFYFCTALKNITVNANNLNYKSVDGNIYSKDGKTLLVYAAGKTATTFVVPSGVENLGTYAFARSANLESVDICDSVISIGHGAFEGCATLQTVTIGANVQRIGQGAFGQCSNLTSATFNGLGSWMQTSNSDYTSGSSITLGEPSQNAAALLSGARYYWYKV